MTTLRSTITELASAFASNVLDAIRGMSLDEILRETQGGRGGAARGRPAASAPAAGPAAGGGRRRGKGGRLGRRSAGDIAEVVDRIVSLLEKHPSGLRAEEIRAELGLEAKELPRPITEALASRRISKSGQKRATTYFAKGHGAKANSGGARSKGKRGKSSSSSKKSAKKKAAGGKRSKKKAGKAPGAAAPASAEANSTTPA